MKKILSLSLIAVCMTVFTSMATTTATTEQKQKTEVVSDVNVQTMTVSVVTDYQFVSFDYDALVLDNVSVINSETDFKLPELSKVGFQPDYLDNYFHLSNQLDTNSKEIVSLTNKGNNYKPSRS